MTFEEDRSKLSGLHFAKEMLSQHELETLATAERVLQRLDAIRELCKQAKREGDPETASAWDAITAALDADA